MTTEDEVRAAFGGREKEKKKTNGRNEKVALAAFHDNGIVEAPKGTGTVTKQDEQDLLEAFGGGPEADIYESFNPLVLEEAAVGIDNVNGHEEYKIKGTLVDSTEKTLDRKHEYPQSLLQKIVNNKLWRNGQIFLSHAGRSARDIKRLCGKVLGMHLDGNKLKFQATLQKAKIDQVPGLSDALQHKNLGISMAVMKPKTTKDGIVTDCEHISLDLLADLSHPAIQASRIESVV